MAYVLDKIEDLENLPFAITYAGTVSGKSDGAQVMDSWRVKLAANGKEHTFEYYTGLGHRTREFRPAKDNADLGARYDARHHGYPRTKPVAPKIAGVMYCLLSDATAAGQSFEDWCADFGFSDDSEKAEKTYDGCVLTARALRKFFNEGELAAMRELLQDY